MEESKKRIFFSVISTDVTKYVAGGRCKLVYPW